MEVFLKNLWYNDNIGILRKSWEESWLFFAALGSCGSFGKGDSMNYINQIYNEDCIAGIEPVSRPEYGHDPL